MYVCMYAWMDGWMYMYMYIYTHTNIITSIITIIIILYCLILYYGADSPPRGRRPGSPAASGPSFSFMCLT